MRTTMADVFELGQYQTNIQICMTGKGLHTFTALFTCNACDLHTLERRQAIHSGRELPLTAFPPFAFPFPVHIR